jgi:predicted HTH domain antitoxin
MKTLAINLPESVELDNKELTIFIAAKLFEASTLTMGQAAEMAGLSIADFMDTLYKFNVSIFNYPASELESDVKNATESIRRH